MNVVHCEVCGLPCGGPLSGNPKVWHWACLMSVTTHLREPKMKIEVKPGKVVPSFASGNPWQFTIVHPTNGEARHARTFATPAEAKAAMREFVKNWNECKNDE